MLFQIKIGSFLAPSGITISHTQNCRIAHYLAHILTYSFMAAEYQINWVTHLGDISA